MKNRGNRLIYNVNYDHSSIKRLMNEMGHLDLCDVHKSDEQRLS